MVYHAQLVKVSTVSKSFMYYFLPYHIEWVPWNTIRFSRGLSGYIRPIFVSSMIVPRSESFRQVAKYQIGMFSPELGVSNRPNFFLDKKIRMNLISKIETYKK